ncbi:hypothetical protein Ae201684_016270 [Aphanomyces euteiches]|nr:hypothetical protein Ae201684_016270 [Aphanomyces euteiches]
MPLGCCIIGDSGYALFPWLITPFLPHEEGGRLNKLKKRFNYKLSSTRMVVECSFGRLKERFRILKSVMNEKSLSRTVENITACFVLHNIFINFKDRLFDVPNPRRDRNDYVQLIEDDKSSVEPNRFLRAVAVAKRLSIAKLIYHK